jgi:predicted nucleic acid-binding protein
MIQLSNPAGAAVVDANFMISIAANEPNEPKSRAALARYSTLGYQFYAPGVVAAEALYVLCGKLSDGSLSVADHEFAVRELDMLLKAEESRKYDMSVGA